MKLAYFYVSILKIFILLTLNKFYYQISVWQLYKSQILKGSLQIANKIMSSIKKVELNGKQYLIDLKKKIQQTSTGPVYYSHSIQTKEQPKQQYAVKIVEKIKGKSNSCIYAPYVGKAVMLKNLNHQNIVKVKQVIQTSNNIYAFQELCDSDLADKIKQNGLTELQCVDLLTQICNGYYYLRSEGVVHKGLKPTDILLKNKMIKIRILDKLKNQNCQISNDISPLSFYLPLQTAKSGIYSQKQDVWAIGMMYYQLLHKKLPFTESNIQQFYQKFRNNHLPVNKFKISAWSSDFLQKTLVLQQKNRMSWEELFKHPIFSNFFSKKAQNGVLQDRLKIIMRKLKTIIEGNNFSLKRILNSLGFSDPNKEINFHAFQKFLHKIQPSISQSQAQYIFQKVDTNNSKGISIEQMQTVFSEHNINFNPEPKEIKAFNRKVNPEQQHNERICKDAQEHVTNMFSKLYQVVNGNLDHFQKIFNNFAQSNKIDLKSFQKLIMKLNGSILRQQIQQAFKVIDEDKSQFIDFIQFESFFYRVNGLPPKIRVFCPPVTEIKTKIK